MASGRRQLGGDIWGASHLRSSDIIWDPLASVGIIWKDSGKGSGKSLGGLWEVSGKSLGRALAALATFRKNKILEGSK